jgi:hypothetical protein
MQLALIGCPGIEGRYLIPGISLHWLLVSEGMKTWVNANDPQKPSPELFL